MKTKITQRSLRFLPVFLALALGLFAVMSPAQAMHPDGVINDAWDGVAIKGYDPVAYFTMGRAVKGSEEFTHEWLETEWQFASAEHRDLFQPVLNVFHLALIDNRDVPRPAFASKHRVQGVANQGSAQGGNEQGEIVLPRPRQRFE